MSIAEGLLLELEQEAKRTERVLERIPEDRLTWKPHPKSFSLGELALHIASQGRIAEFAAKDVHEINIQPPAQPRNRQEILDAFAAGTADAQKVLAKMDDATLQATWTGQINGKTVLCLPRAALLRMVMMNHIYHHRGQLSVYLRILGVAIPSIYGPSADENPFAAAAAA
jgi:uncharacterized damage-inducible protein DinB